MARIDYRYWFDLPRVRAWEAIALTLGINPEGMSTRDDFEDQFPSADVEGEFRKRLRLLLASLSDRAKFSAPTLNLSNPAEHGIPLTQVVMWLQKLGRKPLSKGLLKAMPTAAAPEIPVAASTPKAKTATKQQQWNVDIVRAIEELGFRPKALPKTKRGLAGARSQVRKHLKIAPGDKGFTNAWDAALNAQIIAFSAESEPA